MCSTCEHMRAGQTLREVEHALEVLRRSEREAHRDENTTVLVIARTAEEFRQYCRDNGLDSGSPRVVFVHTEDTTGWRHFQGLRDMEAHRVDGAVARENVERELDHLEARGLVREAVPPREVVEDVYSYTVEESGRIVRRVPTGEAQIRLYGAGRPDFPLEGMLEPHIWDRVRVESGPPPDTGMRAPHHWASTLERSPYWDRRRGVLTVDSGAYEPMCYRPDELEDNIRYV